MKTRLTIVALAALGASGAAAFGQSGYRAVPIPAGEAPVISGGPDGPGLDLSWATIDGGGRELGGGTISLAGTVGQPDAGMLSQGTLSLSGGFWDGVEALAPCYADCDQSGGSPRLTPNDFACFLNRFTSGESYANCDGSTVPPTLNINDFVCFINQFAAGCS